MSRGKTTARAVVSLVLLAGFYVYAPAVAAGVLGLGMLAVRAFGGLLSLKIMIAASGVALAVFAGLAAALRKVSYPSDGLRVSRSDAPALWEFVDDTARRVGTRTVDALTLVPEVNAGVYEVTGFLGLKPGRRSLALGVPLLTGMSAVELRSILAHEFGHYAHVHTRLSTIVHRGRMAIKEVTKRLKQRAPYVAWILVPYTILFLAVEAAVSRRQELEADGASARIAGPAAAEALRTLHRLNVAWRRFRREEVECGLPHGLAPRGIWTGFGTYLDDLDTELRALAEETPDPGPGPYDSHPPMAERITRLERIAGEAETEDAGRARGLLPEAVWSRPDLDALTLDAGARTVLDWPEFGSRVFLAIQRHLAGAGYRQIARVTGTASLSAVLDQYGDVERARRWYREYVGPDFPEAGMSAIVLTAAHDAGGLAFRHRWRKWLIVHPDGTEFAFEDYFARLEAAIEDLRPEGAERLRALLAELGVDPADAVGATTRADARTAAYIGLESNVSFDGRPHDMAVTDEGIVLLPCPKSTAEAKERLVGYVKRYTPRQLTALAGAVWIAYEEIAAAKVLRRAPLKVRLTLEDGRDHVLARAFLSETVGDPAKGLFARIALLVRRPARQAD